MIALALSPIARWAVGALIILGVLGGIYAKGRIDGRKACEDRVRAAVAAEQTRQAGVRAKALDAAVGRELAAREANEALEQQVTDYEAAIAREPAPVAGTCAPSFHLRGVDVDGLRKLQR